MNGHMNGVYTAIKTNDGVHAVYIEEEILELGRLNRITDQRRAENEQRVATAARVQKEKMRKLAQEAERRRRATIRLIKQEAKVLAGSVIVGLAWKAGLVAAAFAVPVLIAWQTVIFFRAGKYFGKYPVRWFK